MNNFSFSYYPGYSCDSLVKRPSDSAYLLSCTTPGPNVHALLTVANNGTLMASLNITQNENQDFTTVTLSETTEDAYFVSMVQDSLPGLLNPNNVTISVVTKVLRNNSIEWQVMLGNLTAGSSSQVGACDFNQQTNVVYVAGSGFNSFGGQVAQYPHLSLGYLVSLFSNSSIQYLRLLQDISGSWRSHAVTSYQDDAIIAGYRAFTARFNINGTLLWYHKVTDTNIGFYYDVKVYGNTTVSVGGFRDNFLNYEAISGGESSEDMIMVFYNINNGSLVSAVRYGTSREDFAKAMSIDDVTGTAYLVGFVNDDQNAFLTCKLSQNNCTNFNISYIGPNDASLQNVDYSILNSESSIALVGWGGFSVSGGLLAVDILSVSNATAVKSITQSYTQSAASTVLSVSSVSSIISTTFSAIVMVQTTSVPFTSTIGAASFASSETVMAESQMATTEQGYMSSQTGLVGVTPSSSHSMQTNHVTAEASSSNLPWASATFSQLIQIMMSQSMLQSADRSTDYAAGQSVSVFQSSLETLELLQFSSNQKKSLTYSTSILQTSVEIQFAFSSDMTVLWISIAGVAFAFIVVIAYFTCRRSRQIPTTQVKSTFSTEVTDTSSFITSSIAATSVTSIVTENVIAIPSFLKVVYGTDFSVGSQIAAGGQGAICHVQVYDFTELKRRIQSKQVVAKAFNCSAAQLSPGMKIAFDQEVTLHWYFKDALGFAQIYGYCEAPYATIIMQYYPLGSLTAFIQQRNQTLSVYLYSKLQVLRIMIGVSSAIRFMHYRKIAHCDIKPDNVLLDVDGRNGLLVPVLTDFGIARVLDTYRLQVEAFQISKVKGLSLQYASPETIFCFRNQVKQDEKLLTLSDVYSIGAVMYELLHRKRLWPGK